jgi:16S rRNA (guanine(966)-N(2))-methyltransferase RsmD
MRIIGGIWRSRRITRPDTRGTRPMPDRVKEAIFSMLGAHYDCPGSLPPIRVADVFAGGGSMGLEALSRGAAMCCFHERNNAALRALRDNLDTLGTGPEAIIITRDAWQASIFAPDGRAFDLILLDPPYRETQDASTKGAVRRYLARIAKHDDNRPLVVLHHAARIRFKLEPEDEWHVADTRTFGSNAVTVFSR